MGQSLQKGLFGLLWILKARRFWEGFTNLKGSTMSHTGRPARSKEGLENVDQRRTGVCSEGG